MVLTDATIGKGQGNYEVLDTYPENVFFIPKAKCEIIAENMGVRTGQVGLISTRMRRAVLNAGLSWK